MTPHKVAIITGASRGIGAALVAGYRITELATVGQIVDAALKRSLDVRELAGPGSRTGRARAAVNVEGCERTAR
jgi:NAD(P)-dependent dehydrogenase (short-subunit alcohol dehydrogenase family)